GCPSAPTQPQARREHQIANAIRSRGNEDIPRCMKCRLECRRIVASAVTDCTEFPDVNAVLARSALPAEAFLVVGCHRCADAAEGSRENSGERRAAIQERPPFASLGPPMSS